MKREVGVTIGRLSAAWLGRRWKRGHFFLVPVCAAGLINCSSGGSTGPPATPTYAIGATLVLEDVQAVEGGANPALVEAELLLDGKHVNGSRVEGGTAFVSLEFQSLLSSGGLTE